MSILMGPIAFATRKLTTAEQNYAQLEKEALELVFGVKRFHPYLFGRTFTLVTDHRPLTTILGPKTGMPSLAAARLSGGLLCCQHISTTLSSRGQKPIVMRMDFPGYHYLQWERTSRLWLMWIFSTLRKWKHSCDCGAVRTSYQT